MAFETVEIDIEDGVAVLRLNRPSALNAFTVQMADDLVEAFAELAGDSDVKAIVVTGEGRAFCAGMDLRTSGNVFGLDESQHPQLSDLVDRLEDPAIERGVRDTGGRVSLAIFDCPKPVIGAINGAAVGIGATMTLPMDFRFASSEAQIGFVFARLGIVPEGCSSWFLPRIVGLESALELTYSGRVLTADEAREIGLVRQVCPPNDLVPQATAFAHNLVDGRSAVGIALTRHMMYRNSSFDHPIEAHRRDSLAMFYTSLGDGKEGVDAFLNKRPPAFTARVPQDLPPTPPWTER